MKKIHPMLKAEKDELILMINEEQGKRNKDVKLSVIMKMAVKLTELEEAVIELQELSKK